MQPDSCNVICLWAANDHHGPQFVAAVHAALDEIHPDEVKHLRAIVEEWFENWGDDKGWRFWTTHDRVHRPTEVPDLEALRAEF